MSEHNVQEIDGVQEEMALFVRILARPLRIWNYWPQIRPKLDEEIKGLLLLVITD